MNNLDSGKIYLGKNSRGSTYINEDGDDTLLNDKSGFTGVNLQGSKPENNFHVMGDRPVTIQNNNLKTAAHTKDHGYRPESSKNHLKNNGF